MRIYCELNLEEFEAWSGAIPTLERIRTEGKIAELESMLEELYPEGMDETELNDLLWFDDEQVFEWLGIRTEEQIEAEIEELKEQRENLIEEYKNAVEEEIEEINSNRELEGLNELNEEEIVRLSSKIWSEYRLEIEELEEDIRNLKWELKEP